VFDWECFGVFLEKNEQFLMIFHCRKHAHRQKGKKAIFRFFVFFAISTPSNDVGHGWHAKPSLFTH
jgi:hypothetical protein